MRRKRKTPPQACYGPLARLAARGHAIRLARRRSASHTSLDCKNVEGTMRSWLTDVLKIAGLVGFALFGVSLPASEAQTAPRKVKVLIISLFEPEAKPWIENLALSQKVTVPGLSAEFPDAACNADDVCLITTGMGHANAAASTMALVFSRQFDLSKAYILIAGIAGIDPAMGTLGTPACAPYLLDFRLHHTIHPTHKPAAWATGYLGIRSADPNTTPVLDYRTE